MFEVLDTATVDEELWYVVRISEDNADAKRWIRTQNRRMWHEYGGGEYKFGSIFDVHEKLFTLLSLKLNNQRRLA